MFRQIGIVDERKKGFGYGKNANPALRNCPGCGRPIFGFSVCPLCEAKRRAEQSKAKQGKEANA